jgi:hypothetical protein
MFGVLNATEDPEVPETASGLQTFIAAVIKMEEALGSSDTSHLPPVNVGEALQIKPRPRTALKLDIVGCGVLPTFRRHLLPPYL